MMCQLWFKRFLSILLLFELAYGEKPFTLKLERADIKYADEACLKNVSASVTKANRTAPYVLNFQMELLKPWLDNITVASTSYEFKNNQYKKSFIQTSNTVCDLMKEGDQFLIGSVRKFSNLPKRCPLPIGVFEMKDFVLIESFFPSGFPISKWRFNYNVKGTTTSISILKIDIYFAAEPRLKRKTNKVKP